MDATSPASLAANYFLLANLLAGSSLDTLISIDGVNGDVSTDADVTCCALVRVLTFLTADDQISCSSFASKAGLLECANALISLLGEMIERRSEAGQGKLMDKIAFRVSERLDIANSRNKNHL